MALLPKVKLKALVSFPATVLDGAGIDVVKSNGSYQFNLDYEDFAPPVSSFPDSSNENALVWNSETETYTLVPIGLLTTSDPALNTPLIESGSGTVGTSLKYAREDHVHPEFGEAIITVATIAALKAINVTAETRIFVAGYYAEGDGGGGWFYGATSSAATDNGGTIIAPTSGSGRWLRDYDGQNINVKWFGIKGDNSTESLTMLNAARDAAIAVKGGLYFPATTSRYLLPTAGLVIPDDTHGLRIFGDARSGQSPGAVNTGTTIVTTGATLINMTAISIGGTGSISDIVIENVNLYSSGTTGKALKSWNVDNLILTNVLMNASQGNALDMSGTANFNFRNIWCYSLTGSPLYMSNEGVGTQSCGPGSITGGQFTIASGAAPVLDIKGDPLGVVFAGCHFTWPNSTAATAIDINGPTSGTAYGSISFLQCHGESTYNTINTGVMFRIGNANKAGAVIIDGGNYWGHGNGTNYMRDFVQVVAARHVAVHDVLTSRLASVNGFSRSMIRLELTFPAAGDTYEFRGMKYDGSGAMYSDANLRILGLCDASYDHKLLNTLSLGNALAVNMGGTGDTGTAYTSFTPTITSGTGTITTVGTVAGGYKRTGKQCHFWIRFDITTNGTGATRLEATLPFTAANSAAFSAVFRSSGIVCSCAVITTISATKALLTNSTGAYPGSDGSIHLITGTYETT
jgi:hypothetical protein